MAEGTTAMESRVQALQGEVCSLEASMRHLCCKLRSIYGHGGVTDVPGSDIVEAAQGSPKEAPPTLNTLEDCIQRVLEASKWLSEIAAAV